MSADIAKTAYAAYARYTGGKTYDGRDMPPFADLGPVVQGAWRAAATTTAVTTAAPTQARHPWRATGRTIAAALIALLPLLPAIVDALGVAAVPWVMGGLGVIAGVTRVLAMPAVNDWVSDYLPWLAAEPRDTP